MAEKKTIKVISESASVPPVQLKEPVMPQIANFPTIRKGDTGAYVTVLQSQLKNRGYDIGPKGISGDFDDATITAVKAFQKDLGYAVQNGVVGKKTWMAIQNSQVVSKDYINVHKQNNEPKKTESAQEPTYTLQINGLNHVQADILAKIFRETIDCHIVVNR